MNRSTATDEALTAALVDLAGDGIRPPCGDHLLGYLWTSEDAAEREAAARMCGPCPIRQTCHVAAEARGELFVWAGIDRGVTPGRTKNKEK